MASHTNLMAEDDQQTQMNDPQARDAPAGIGGDDDYTSRVGQKQAPVPVQKDADPVEDPIDAETADSDQQLEKDENEAINKNNIIESRTRGAAKPSGTYQEPGDEQGLPGPNDGTSQLRTEPLSNQAQQI